MKSVASALALALTLAPCIASGQAAHGELSSLKGNVARIDAGDRTGFGFIVGLADRAVLIATAWHTLRGMTVDSVTVCFPLRGETCGRGSVAYIADAIGSQPALDLAIVRADYPEGLVWRPDVLAERPGNGEPLWFIGRSRDWYIPNDAGRASAFDPAKQLVSYRHLQVAEGVSGAPIVSRQGVVAMHVESLGGDGEARGVDIHAIRSRVVEGLRAQWALVPRAECDTQSAHARVLSGRNVVVHFDGRRASVGLDAIARLNCLGARGIPRPVWSTDAWAGNGIAYGSGELRAARALQSVLVAHGRLDTRLADAEGGLEIWLR
jgi:hypothetical protein